ncbi:MAG: glycosyltransferase family 2 protein [Alphaproteobacteria bacterium]|nr:glycosyltransferase family 2 protein [Alphaproteobacteria bacterium]
MDKAPEISVIVPVYNVEKYLGRCLDSILASTFKDIEVILVDDCGQDNSRAICDEYAAKDARVRVISNPHNMGVSVARNNGLDNARGKYISFIDSDDYIDRTMFEKLYKAMERENVDMVGCNAWNVEENGKKEIIRYLKVKKDVKTSFAELGNKIYESAFHVFRFLFKREVLNNVRFPIGIVYAEDAAFLLGVYPQTQAIYFLSEPLYFYFENNSSASVSRSAKKFSSLKIKDAVMEKFVANPKSELIHSGFWLWYTLNMAHVYNDLLPLELQGAFIEEIRKILPYDCYNIFIRRIENDCCQYYLFDFIPILTVKKRQGKKYVKLFGKIPLYKVKYYS